MADKGTTAQSFAGKSLATTTGGWATTTGQLSETRLSVLSSAPSLPQWTFGKESRFFGNELATPSPQSSFDGRSRSCPALHAGEEEYAAGGDEASQLDSVFASTVGGAGFDQWQTWRREKPAVRMDTSLQRFEDPPGQRDRKAYPKPISYTPSVTLGEGTSPAYSRSPHFSFGGGRSRLEEAKPNKLARNQAQTDAARQRALETIAENKEKSKKIMSRHFGSAPKMQVKGGYGDMPFSPGPAAYEVPRDGDPEPEWSSASRRPWGIRTAQRQALHGPAVTDVGPGEHSAGHAFSGASVPSPMIGLRLRVPPKDVVPGPGKYPGRHGSTLSEVGPASIGRGPRESCTAELQGRSPGPAKYKVEPSDGVTQRQTFHATFGHGERRHFSDDVDPDEPPGPGAHKVRKDPKVTDMPRTAFPKAERLKTMDGMLPPWSPLPGAHSPKLPPSSCAKSFPKAFPARPQWPKEAPGPGDYETDKSAIQERSPQYAPLAGRTALRRSEFDRTDGAKELDAQIQRVAAEVEVVMEAEGRGVKQRDDYKFVPAGPSYHMVGRPKPEKPRELGATMYGAASSLR